MCFFFKKALCQLKIPIYGLKALLCHSQIVFNYHRKLTGSVKITPTS